MRRKIGLKKCIRWDALAVILSTWSFHFRSPLKVTPNILADLTILKVVPLAGVLCILVNSVWICRRMSIDGHDAMCLGSLLYQTWGQFSKPWRRRQNFHLAERVLFVVVRSFIMTRKSHGPTQVPCGIPAGTGMNSETTSWQQWALLLDYKAWRSVNCGPQDRKLSYSQGVPSVAPFKPVMQRGNEC